MEHLDPDEEDEEGEASASTHARNKAITALLGGSSPKNNAADSYDDDSDADEKAPGVRELFYLTADVLHLRVTVTLKRHLFVLF